MTDQKESATSTKASCCQPRTNAACGCARATSLGSGVDRGCCCGGSCECGDTCECPAGCGCGK